MFQNIRHTRVEFKFSCLYLIFLLQWWSDSSWNNTNPLRKISLITLFKSLLNTFPDLSVREKVDVNFSHRLLNDFLFKWEKKLKKMFIQIEFPRRVVFRVSSSYFFREASAFECKWRQLREKIRCETEAPTLWKNHCEGPWKRLKFKFGCDSGLS